MNKRKSIIDKAFSPSTTNPFSKLHLILSLFIGIIFISDSFRNILNNGFSDQVFKFIFAMGIGILSLFNAFTIFKANNYKI